MGIDPYYLHIFLNYFEYEPTTKTKNVLIPILIPKILEMRMLYPQLMLERIILDIDIRLYRTVLTLTLMLIMLLIQEIIRYFQYLILMYKICTNTNIHTVTHSI